MTDVDPAAAGMDEARLERITDHLTHAYIEPGKIAGCQVLVSRHGRPAYRAPSGRWPRAATARSPTTPCGASTR